MQDLAYKPHLDAVLKRLESLYARRAQDQIFATMQIPSRAVQAFAQQYAHGFCDYPDPEERIRFWDAYLQEKIGVEDDSVPSIYLSEFDQGLYGGVLGGQVECMCHPENGWISSMVKPLLTDWSEFDRLHFDPAHPWFQRYLRQMAIFTRAAEGKFGISHFILIDSLNFVFELLGATRTYLSLIEQPDMVRRAIEFAYDLNVRIQTTFFETVPALRGGTCSNMVQWIPGRIVSESVDPFHMTSPRYFEEWGRAPVQRILDHFDGGVLHLHGNGRHLIEAIATVRGLKAVRTGDDKGYPPAHTLLGEFRRRAGDLPLITEIPAFDFFAGLERHTLTGGVFYKVQGEIEPTEANRWMEKIHAYRA